MVCGDDINVEGAAGRQIQCREESSARSEQQHEQAQAVARVDKQGDTHTRGRRREGVLLGVESEHEGQHAPVAALRRADGEDDDAGPSQQPRQHVDAHQRRPSGRVRTAEETQACHGGRHRPHRPVRIIGASAPDDHSNDDRGEQCAAQRDAATGRQDVAHEQA